MAVTKQTYTATATWTDAGLADLFRDAFIDAGLMTAWHDEFSAGTGRIVRVLKIEHDPTKTYGSSFYCFIFRHGTAANDHTGIALASGWDASSDVPTGTQFLDYHRLPIDISSTSTSSMATSLSGFQPSTAANIFLDRFTSSDDTKQSWFVLRQGLNRSAPFSILHKNTSLHPWLDLDKGIISGFSTVGAWNSSGSQAGFISFRLEENLRRCLLIGHALRGDTATSDAANKYHLLRYSTHSYMGVGSQTNNSVNNLPSAVKQNGAAPSAVALPVGKNSANPAFLTDYVPICTDLPWSPFTPTRLADDFGVYMHYADNTTAYGDRFIVQAGVNEWETLQFANNSVVVDGASPAFLARVV